MSYKHSLHLLLYVKCIPFLCVQTEGQPGRHHPIPVHRPGELCTLDPYRHRSEVIHITPVLAALDWFPVRFRIKYKVALTIFKALHGSAPRYIMDMLIPHCLIKNLRLLTYSLTGFYSCCFQWLPLEGVKSGRVRLVLEWVPMVSQNTSLDQVRETQSLLAQAVMTSDL